MTQVCNGPEPGGVGMLRRETAVLDLSSVTSLPCDLIQTIVLPDVGFSTCKIRELGYSTFPLLKLSFQSSGSQSQACVGHLGLTLELDSVNLV